jgi:hypothetical protein
VLQGDSRLDEMRACDRLKLGGVRVHRMMTALVIALAVDLPLDGETKALLGKTLHTQNESATHRLSIATKNLRLP